jgi:uncharacterized membrane protein YraQ (UPF0718 family)
MNYMIEIVMNVLIASWEVYREVALYMLFGFFIAGLLYVFLRSDQVGRYLGKGRLRPVFISALLGVPIPLCSCGVVPAAAGLKRQGASKGSVLSFLISTPESGVDSIAVTYALMDPLMTVMRPLAGFVTAIVAGITESVAGKGSTEPARPAGAPRPAVSEGVAIMGEMPERRETIADKMGKALRYAYVELLGDIGRSFVVGVFIAGMITCVVPDDFTALYAGNNFLAMLMMMAFGIPMYVCATASTPIAAALILKGLNPGAALVFLLVGPATNAATISMVGSLLGKRSLMIYLGSIALCSLAMGAAVDALYTLTGISPRAVAGSAAEIIPGGIELISAAILAALILYNIILPLLPGERTSCTCSTPASR